MGSPYGDVGGLNPEPTGVQLATYLRHKAAGTSPGNPKWYKPFKAPAPFKFVPGMKPVYPHLPSGADWFTKHHSQTLENHPDVVVKYK